MRRKVTEQSSKYQDLLTKYKTLKSPSFEDLKEFKSSLDTIHKVVDKELDSIRNSNQTVDTQSARLLSDIKKLQEEVDKRIKSLENAHAAAARILIENAKQLSDAKEEIEKSIDLMVKDIKTLRDSKLSDGSTFLKSGDKNLNVINKLIGDLEAAKHLTYHKRTDIEQIKKAVQTSFTQANAEIDRDPKGKKISDALTKICNFGLKAINVALNVFRKNAKEAVLYTKPSDDYKSKLQKIVEFEKDNKSSSNPNPGH